MGILDPSFDLQKAIYARLIASPDLTALVPVTNIADVTTRPELMPCVIFGEGQTVFRRFSSTAYCTLHVWFSEPGLDQCKQAVGIIAEVLRVDAQIDGQVLRLDNFVAHDVSISQTRFLRDPHGTPGFSHGILTVAAICKQVAL